MLKKFKIVLGILIVLCIIIPSISMATYQSRPGFSALVNTTAQEFWYNIRLMEATGRSFRIKYAS